MAEIKGTIKSSRKDFIDLFSEHKNILSDMAVRINCSWFVQQMARFILDEMKKCMNCKFWKQKDDGHYKFMPSSGLCSKHSNHTNEEQSCHEHEEI